MLRRELGFGQPLRRVEAAGEWLQRILTGDRRPIARAITAIENNPRGPINGRRVGEHVGRATV